MKAPVHQETEPEEGIHKDRKKKKAKKAPAISDANGGTNADMVEAAIDEDVHTIKKKKKVKKALVEEINGDANGVEEVPEEIHTEKKIKKVKRAEAVSDPEVTTKKPMVTSEDPREVSESVVELAEKKKKKKGKKANGITDNSTEEPKPISAPAKGTEENDAASTKAAGPMTPKHKGSVVKSAKHRMKDDLAYISELLSYVRIPQHGPGPEEAEGEVPEEARERLLLNRAGGQRAASREELQQRLRDKVEQLRGSFGPNDRKKEKTLKRRMAALERDKEGKELKQKLMQIGINAGKKNPDIAKEAEAMGAKVTKPGVKTERGVVFSKFDFQEMEKEKKKTLDPATALKKIQKSKEKVKMWEDKGRSEKAKNIEGNIAWDNALGKAQGEKIKDDETLLKKAIKKKQQIKGSKKKKWEARVESVEGKKASKQSKREENLSKRKKEKKDKKVKHAVAKGRHVPGF